MTLTFVLPQSDADHRQWPHGFWYCTLMGGDYDGVGATPLDALAQAVAEMEDGEAAPKVCDHPADGHTSHGPWCQRRPS